jgi:membrane-associated phospholipid phosphatase
MNPYAEPVVVVFMAKFWFRHPEFHRLSDEVTLSAIRTDAYAKYIVEPVDPQPEHGRRYLVNAALSMVVLGGMFFLMRFPDFFDRPVVALLNGYATLHPAVNWIMFRFDNDSIYSGAAMTALVWWCWFDTGTAGRVRLLTGTLAAFPAGIISRFLQHQLSSHPRPAYDPLQNFKLPEMLQDGIYNTWNSFPSDHATVFFGLVTTIYIFRPKIGIAAGIYLAIVESSRMFMGAHYPTDLIGGAALASAIIWAVQAPFFLNLAGRVVRYERIGKPWFYATGFLILYQVATLFGDIRNLTGGFHIIGLFR